MDDNHKHYIRKDFEKLNENTKKKFLVLLNFLIKFEIKIINNINNKILIIKDNFNENIEIFKNKEIYLFIKNTCNKYKKVKGMDKTMNKYISIEDKIKYLKIYKTIILFNLIIKRLDKKTLEEINEYKLNEKLEKIDKKLLNFNLGEKNENFNYYIYIIDFVNNVYINEEIYNKIYELYELFI